MTSRWTGAPACSSEQAQQRPDARLGAVERNAAAVDLQGATRRAAGLGRGTPTRWRAAPAVATRRRPSATGTEPAPPRGLRAGPDRRHPRANRLSPRGDVETRLSRGGLGEEPVVGLVAPAAGPPGRRARASERAAVPVARPRPSAPRAASRASGQAEPGRLRARRGPVPRPPGPRRPGGGTRPQRPRRRRGHPRLHAVRPTPPPAPAAPPPRARGRLVAGPGPRVAGPGPRVAGPGPRAGDGTRKRCRARRPTARPAVPPRRPLPCRAQPAPQIPPSRASHGAPARSASSTARSNARASHGSPASTRGDGRAQAVRRPPANGPASPRSAASSSRRLASATSPAARASSPRATGPGQVVVMRGRAPRPPDRGRARSGGHPRRPPSAWRPGPARRRGPAAPGAGRRRPAPARTPPPRGHRPRAPRAQRPSFRARRAAASATHGSWRSMAGGSASIQPPAPLAASRSPSPPSRRRTASQSSARQ